MCVCGNANNRKAEMIIVDVCVYFPKMVIVTYGALCMRGRWDDMKYVSISRPSAPDIYDDNIIYITIAHLLIDRYTCGTF